MYNIGDCVVIDLNLGVQQRSEIRQYNHFYDSDMQLYRGLTATIQDRMVLPNNTYYRIDVDRGEYKWTAESFTPARLQHPPVAHSTLRLTIDEVVLYIERTGLVPVITYDPYVFIDNDKVGANLVGLVDCAAMGGDPHRFFQEHYDPRRSLHLFYSSYYVIGLNEGFQEDRGTYRGNEERNLGRQDGSAIRRHLINTNLMERRDWF
jgi:hypothetical protein